MTPTIIDTSIDGHVHTAMCHHASGSMEDYVLAGIERGLKKIVFLEHLETGINYFESTWLTDDDFDRYFAEGRRLQRKYQGAIAIGLGGEVGFNPERTVEILQRLDRHEWDRIGISYHFLAAAGRHLNLVSSQQQNIEALARLGVDTVLDHYFHCLREAVRQLPGTVLCHFDAVLRHHPAAIDFSKFSGPIERLLDAVAQKNMAVEVNTSGYKIRGEVFPAQSLLPEVVKRGIPLTAGSDAHRPQDVGRYFERLGGLISPLAAN
jgi:histidinol-phosphatase (PHP family)